MTDDEAKEMAVEQQRTIDERALYTLSVELRKNPFDAISFSKKLTNAFRICKKAKYPLNLNKIISLLEDPSSSLTLLQYAAYLGNIVGVYLLLEKGAKPNSAPIIPTNHFSVGTTPLHYAAMKGDENIVLLLLIRGANPNLTLANHAGQAAGYTPLHFAAKGNYVNVARLLLQYRANPFLKTTWGKTPLEETNFDATKEITSFLQRVNSLYNRPCFSFFSHPHRDTIQPSAQWLREHSLLIYSENVVPSLQRLAMCAFILNQREEMADSCKKENSQINFDITSSLAYKRI